MCIYIYIYIYIIFIFSLILLIPLHTRSRKGKGVRCYPYTSVSVDIKRYERAGLGIGAAEKGMRGVRRREGARGAGMYLIYMVILLISPTMISNNS